MKNSRLPASDVTMRTIPTSDTTVKAFHPTNPAVKRPAQRPIAAADIPHIDRRRHCCKQ
jgi:hypothetical protein